MEFLIHDFGNVIISEESREVAAHISAKKLVKKFGQYCKIYSIHESETEPLMAILMYYQKEDLPSECLLMFVTVMHILIMLSI